MKTVLPVIAALMLFCGTATAEPSGYGISLGYGSGSSDIDVVRVGVKKQFSSRWFESAGRYVSGYFELSYNRWKYHDDVINAVAFSPVFTYCFGGESDRIKPYIEGGVGIACLDEDHIGQRDLSTRFQFEDRIGAGARIGSIDLNVRYMHYSNGSIKLPNDGIDIWMVTTALQF